MEDEREPFCYVLPGARCTDLTDQTAFDFGGFLRAYAENMYALRNSLEYCCYAEFHDIDR